MAIDIRNPEHRDFLQRAVRYHDSQLANVRRKRNELVTLYRGGNELENWALEAVGEEELTVYANLIQQFAKGQILALAGRNPKWDVNARVVEQRGTDKEIQNFLNAYSPIIDLPRVFRQVALDTVFGIAAVKIVNGLPPKGIYSPVAPRVYRVAPTSLIYDRLAPCWEEVTFIGDVYLMPLNEARANQNFDPAAKTRLTAWKGSITNNMEHPHTNGGETFQDAYAEEMVRLIDVYLPGSGQIGTWVANLDTYEDILDEPLFVRETPINPYEIIDLLPDPDMIEDLSNLDSLKNYHIASNSLMEKAIRQALQSKRHPMGETGSENDLDNLMDTPDGDAVLIDDIQKIGHYVLPGPDGSLTQLSGLAMSLFSRYGGNLEVALGQGVGAETARQTQALIQQVSNMQALDRNHFEQFQSSVGYKLVSLARSEPNFQMRTIESIPGTDVQIEALWPPPELSPETKAIDEFQFAIVPYSSQFRTPQARVEQLTAASTQILQLFQAATAGAPLNIEVILQDYAEAFDEIPRLREWFSGMEPAQPQSGETRSESINAGSDLRYQPASSPGGGGGNPFDISSPGGPQQGGFQQLGGIPGGN